MGLLQLVRANSIYKFGFLVFQSLFILILSRILGPESFGIYSLIMVNAAIFNLVTGWGVPSGIMYHASKRDFSLTSLMRISNITFLIQILICLIAEGLFLIVNDSFWIWPTKEIKFAIFGVLSVLVLSLMERNYAFYNGYNEILKFHKISFYFTLSIFFFVLLSIFFSIKIEWKVLIATIIAIQLIQSIYSIIYFNNIIDLNKEKNSSIVKRLSVFYNYSILSLIGNALWLMVSKLDVIFVSKLTSNWDLGQYALAARFSQLFFIIPQFLAGILFPWFCSLKFNRNTFEMILRIILMMHMSLGILVYVFSDFLILYVFGQQYAEIKKILWPFLLGSAFLSVQILLAAYFSSQNLLKINIETMIISLFILTILDFILIPIYGIWGAALSVSISYFAAFIFALIKYKNDKRIFNLLIPKWSDFHFIKNRLLRNIIQKS